MKKTIALLLFFVCASYSAQTNDLQWLSDYKEAIKTSETLNNPILVFITDTSNSVAHNKLQKQIFNTTEFNSYLSSFVLLKLDISADTYHKRLATHFTKTNAVPALVLIDKNGNPIEKALTEMSASSISDFMNVLKTKTKF